MGYFRLDAAHPDGPDIEDDFADFCSDCGQEECECNDVPDRHEIAEIIAEHKWEMESGR